MRPGEPRSRAIDLFADVPGERAPDATGEPQTDETGNLATEAPEQTYAIGDDYRGGRRQRPEITDISLER
jgi:hypothetical protein